MASISSSILSPESRVAESRVAESIRKCAPRALRAALLLAIMLLPDWSAAQDEQSDGAASVEVIPLALWQEPPRSLRPVARWWWPGGSVEAPVLEAQLRDIQQAGFGAVEVQPLLLGLGAEDLSRDPDLRSVGQASFRAAVASAAASAAEVGLDFDFTLGSGWPGGLPTAKANAERQLLMSSLDLVGPQQFDGPLPPAPDQSYRGAVEWVLDVLGPPDQEHTLVALLAGRLGPTRDGVPTLEDVRVIPSDLPSRRVSRVSWKVPEGDWRIFAFYENSTGHFVMGGAYPGSEADARVVDHLSQRGADALLSGYADPVLAALPEGQLREVFIDSFELMGELPFTRDFLEAFELHAGYKLTPHLPLLFRKGGESKYGEMIDLFGRGGGPLYASPAPGRATRIREDYESVRRLLFEQRFVARFKDWAKQRGVSLRLQAHGGYGDYLDVYALADVPESEALFASGRFDFLKLAASAAHVAGRRFASSESFITLRLFGTRVSRDEMWLLAGRAYSAGINRLAFHGVPYPYQRADGERWYPFSGGFGRILAGPLPMSSDIDADFLAELPRFNLALARLTAAMSHGDPAADLAWLRSDPIYPDNTSFQLGRVKARAGESDTTQALRARGLVHDRVSRRMLTDSQVSGSTLRVGQARYRALLLDPLETAEPALVEKIASIAEAGIPVLALGALPQRAPGLRAAEARDKRVRAATQRLATQVVQVASARQLEALLAEQVESGLVGPAPGGRLSVSLERRRNPAGETLLVFNESWSAVRSTLRFARAGGELALWDPRTGTRETLRSQVEAGDLISLDLDAAETVVLTLRNAKVAPRDP